MIEAVVAQEAKTRAEAREHERKVRAAVVNKRDELEALPAPELKELCVAKGIAGVLAKPARVEQLLNLWLEDGGVDKALGKKAREAREAEFVAMDKATLQKFCAQAG